jgi:hypothetical protein
MTFTFKLERLDGMPAERATFKTTVLVWNPGDRIPIGPGRTLQVVPVWHSGRRPCVKEREVEAGGLN